MSSERPARQLHRASCLYSPRIQEGSFSETPTPYKIAFYFTAVTVSRGTIGVDGVQNLSAYFRYEFFSETELPVYGILGNSTWSTSYSRKPYM